MSERAPTEQVRKELEQVALGRLTIGGKVTVSTETISHLQETWGLEVTGVVDCKFTERVKLFQEAHNSLYKDRKLAVDGIIGRKTLGILLEEYAPLAELTSIARGESKLPKGHAVDPISRLTLASVEEGLNRWRAKAGRNNLPTLNPANDRRDDSLSQVLQAFQRERGLPTTGHFGKLSAEAIREYLPKFEELISILRNGQEARNTPAPLPGTLPSGVPGPNAPNPTPALRLKPMDPAEMRSDLVPLVFLLTSAQAPNDVTGLRTLINTQDLSNLPPEEGERVNAAINEKEKELTFELDSRYHKMAKNNIADYAMTKRVAGAIVAILAEIKESDPATYQGIRRNWSKEYLSGTAETLFGKIVASSTEEGSRRTDSRFLQVLHDALRIASADSNYSYSKNHIFRAFDAVGLLLPRLQLEPQ